MKENGRFLERKLRKELYTTLFTWFVQDGFFSLRRALSHLIVHPNCQEIPFERYPLPRLPPTTERKLYFRTHLIIFIRLKVFGEGCGKYLLSKRGFPLNNPFNRLKFFGESARGAFYKKAPLAKIPFLIVHKFLGKGAGNPFCQKRGSPPNNH